MPGERREQIREKQRERVLQFMERPAAIVFRPDSARIHVTPRTLKVFPALNRSRIFIYARMLCSPVQGMASPKSTRRALANASRCTARSPCTRFTWRRNRVPGHDYLARRRTPTRPPLLSLLSSPPPHPPLLPPLLAPPPPPKLGR